METTIASKSMNRAERRKNTFGKKAITRMNRKKLDSHSSLNYRQGTRNQKRNDFESKLLRNSIGLDGCTNICRSIREDDWYAELSDIADSLGISIKDIPFNQIHLLKSGWYQQLIKLIQYYEVSLWDDPRKQFAWLDEKEINARARTLLSNVFKAIVLEEYDAIASECDIEDAKVGHQLIDSGDINFICDFDTAEVKVTVEDWEKIRMVACSTNLMECMDNLMKFLKAYVTDILDYAVYKVVEAPM